MNILGRHLTANLPNRGKHVAHDGQARCPTWASSVPISCTFWLKTRADIIKKCQPLYLLTVLG